MVYLGTYHAFNESFQVIKGASNLWINSFNRVIFGYPDYPLTREMIEDIPYASLRIKIGKGPAGLMILQEKTDSQYSWVSKDSVLLKIKEGRIIRSSNLNNDLVDYYFDDNINFVNLTKNQVTHSTYKETVQTIRNKNIKIID